LAVASLFSVEHGQPSNALGILLVVDIKDCQHLGLAMNNLDGHSSALTMPE
jgi:hypothetical protein